MYPTDRQTALWVALNVTKRSILKNMDARLKAKGLPPLRWYDVLWELEREKYGGMRAFELGATHIFQQSNLSRMLKRMIGEGLIVEQVYESDRRGKVINITGKGRRVRKQMWKVYGPLIHEHMSKVANPEDLEIAIAVLSSMTKDRR